MADRRDLAVRIVGGDEVVVAPSYMVSVQTLSWGGYRHICGGVLIHEKWVLTAGHCLFVQTLPIDRVLVGQKTLSDPPQVTRNVVKEIRAPGFRTVQDIAVYDDIGLLELDEPVTTKEPVQVYRDETGSLTLGGTEVTALGWGYVDRSIEVVEDNLRFVNMPVVDLPACNSTLFGLVSHENICAGSKGKDACLGDSGGPLVGKTKQGTALLGIVSWGEDGCGNKPGVYAKVSSYIDFITANTPLTLMDTVGDNTFAPTASNSTGAPSRSPTKFPTRSPTESSSSHISPTTQPPTSKPDQMLTGAIVAIAAGGFVAIVLMVVGVVYMRRKKHAEKETEPTGQENHQRHSAQHLEQVDPVPSRDMEEENDIENKDSVVDQNNNNMTTV